MNSNVRTIKLNNYMTIYQAEDGVISIEVGIVHNLNKTKYG
jgi:hypothetical protein